jgi:hypothetical protein
MSSEITLATVEMEYQEAVECGKGRPWHFSPIDKERQIFTVELISPVDREHYWFEFGFDDYPKKPYLIELFYPPLGQRGTQACYPCGHDTFFHPNLLICHQSSRRAYPELSGPHGDWNMADWRKGAGGMDRLVGILEGIHFRISNKEYYHGRMAKASGT